MEKVTKLKVKYPIGEEPNVFNPEKYTDYRFVLGRKGQNPLVAICMNPSRAAGDVSDRTVNRVISASKFLGYDGWFIVNVYPERATDANNMGCFDETLNAENIKHIIELLEIQSIKEVWSAWGDLKHNNLKIAAQELKTCLQNKGIKFFGFDKLTKAGNPRHPLYLKIDKEKKQYYHFI